MHHRAKVVILGKTWVKKDYNSFFVSEAYKLERKLLAIYLGIYDYILREIHLLHHKVFTPLGIGKCNMRPIIFQVRN